MIPVLKGTVWERAGEQLILMSDPARVFTLEDPRGELEALLGALSEGHLDVNGVTSALRQRFSYLNSGDVANAIKTLDEMGLLLDSSDRGYLTRDQRHRFAGNLAFFEPYATTSRGCESMQKTVMSAEVTVLGTGGIGSTVVMNLAGLGVGKLTLLDADRVEPRNFARQFLYRNRDLGRSKVERAAEWVGEYDPRIAVRVEERWIHGPEDIVDVIQYSDLVVCAADRPAFHLDSWVNTVCVSAGVPFIRGGMRVTDGIYYSVDPGVSPCQECEYRGLVAKEEMPGAAGAPARLLRSLPQVNHGIAPFASMVGSHVAMEALRYLTRFTEPVSAGVLHVLDMLDGGKESCHPWPADPGCSVCPMAGPSRLPRATEMST
jgi:molybdopterin-synthase adenylyltransferase